jgi:uncharacterized alkaline shock family protein YloU
MPVVTSSLLIILSRKFEKKEVITREVQQMTHLEVIEVNVNVVDIKTQAEYQEEIIEHEVPCFL